MVNSFDRSRDVIASCVLLYRTLLQRLKDEEAESDGHVGAYDCVVIRRPRIVSSATFRLMRLPLNTQGTQSKGMQTARSNPIERKTKTTKKREKRRSPIYVSRVRGFGKGQVLRLETSSFVVRRLSEGHRDLVPFFFSRGVPLFERSRRPRAGI
ncbi:hypothetical protein MRX96_046888 [Rhipicephalus microplus]